MSDIYGKLTEHPEYPLTDSRRFTVEIKPHDFEVTRERDNALRRRRSPFCARCGFSRRELVHYELPPEDADR